MFNCLRHLLDVSVVGGEAVVAGAGVVVILLPSSEIIVDDFSDAIW